MTLVLEESLTLEEIPVKGFHKVIKVTDESAYLKAFIAIHSLQLGKAALGGTRIYPYPSIEDALTDVKRLAAGMTSKSAATQSGFGGGKSVIIADPKTQKTEKLFTAFGKAVDLLKGEYICAEDVGCTPEDLSIVAQVTPYVVGLAHPKSSGNPGPFTAWGVFRGIQAAMHQLFGSNSVAGKTVAVQGLGSVGSVLAQLLFWHGAHLILTDFNQALTERMAKEYGARTCAPQDIYEQKCDVFSPCALGGILNPSTITKLRCKAVAGSANNQLLRNQDAEILYRLGILYAPDFVINAGGLINVSEELCEQGYNAQASRNKVDKIYDQLKLIFNISAQNGISTEEAVMRLINYRLQYGIGKREEPIYLHHHGISY